MEVNKLRINCNTAQLGLQFRQCVESVRELNPIEEVARQYTELKPAGKVLQGLCPLPGHSETAASFTAYSDTDSFYCFGCHRGGDVFDLVMAREGLSFAEALRLLLKRARVSLPAVSPEYIGQLENERAVQDALSLAMGFYHQQLMENTKLALWCMDYLHKRGVTHDSIKELRLGVASGSGLLDFLRSKRVQTEVALRAGLAKQLPNGKLVDFLTGRIIFPCSRCGFWKSGAALVSPSGGAS